MARPSKRWMAIRGYTGLYQVSPKGEVRAVFTDEDGKLCYEPMLQQEDRNGYLRVALTDRRGVRKHHYVHVLVCRTFNGAKPGRNYEVAHKDGDRQRNYASNLEWKTKLQNANDRVRHGNDGTGEKNSQARLTAKQVRQIRQRHEDGESASALGREYGVSHVQILNIVKRKRWGHIE